MRTYLLLSCLLAILAAACSTVPQVAPAPETVSSTVATEETAQLYDASWARDPLWDDGMAEVALYDARRPQYGRPESYQAVFVVVKEEFRRPLHVKADPPFEGKDLFAVLKLNAIHSYSTPNYPYHFLLSVFVRRDDPSRLVKLTMGSQEWCGNTFKEVTTWGPAPQLVSHSYFDGEGDATRPLDLGPGDLLEDQLPLALRSLAFSARAFLPAPPAAQPGLERHAPPGPDGGSDHRGRRRGSCSDRSRTPAILEGPGELEPGTADLVVRESCPPHSAEDGLFRWPNLVAPLPPAQAVLAGAHLPPGNVGSLQVLASSWSAKQGAAPLASCLK